MLVMLALVLVMLALVLVVLVLVMVLVLVSKGIPTLVLQQVQWKTVFWRQHMDKAGGLHPKVCLRLMMAHWMLILWCLHPLPLVATTLNPLLRRVMQAVML